MRSSSSSTERWPVAVTGRGTGWVVAQFVLMAAILAAGFAPARLAGAARITALSVVGAVLAIAGAAFAVWASRGARDAR